MKQFEVELRRISYVVADVEAEDKDEAIQKAFEALDVHESDLEYWELSYCDYKETQ